MRISDWSSDVCSSDLTPSFSPTRQKLSGSGETLRGRSPLYAINGIPQSTPLRDGSRDGFTIDGFFVDRVEVIFGSNALQGIGGTGGIVNQVTVGAPRSEEHTSELQSLMRTSYAVFCLKKKKHHTNNQ